MAASYSNINIEDIRGLEDSGNPFSISNNKSPCLLNAEFSTYGTVRRRTKGLTLIGDDDQTTGKGLALHSVCSCSDCNFADPAFDPANPCALPKASDYPTPTGDRFLIRAYEDKNNCQTILQYLSNNLDSWITFDTLDGSHEFDIVNDNCRIWYSNGYSDLKYACFSKGDDCDVVISKAFPTCISEYPNGKILSLIRAVANPSAGSGQTAGFVTFGRAFNGCDDGFGNLCNYIKNNPRYKAYIAGNYSATSTDPNYSPSTDLQGTAVPTNQVGQPNFNVPNPTKAKVCIKVRLFNCSSCDSSTSDGYSKYSITDLEIQNCCDRTLYWFDPQVAPPAGNFTDICVSWNNSSTGDPCTGTSTYCPNFCCGGASLTAEKVKGYIMRKHDNRLFLAGDLQNNLVDYVSYGSQNAQFGLSTVPTHLGDFATKGPFRTTGDAGDFRFDNSCAKVTAMSKIGSDLYFHRYSGEPELHKATLFTPSDTSIPGSYIPVQEYNSNAANWFRNTVVTNGLQYYISAFNGINELDAYGVFEGFGFKTSKTKSARIRRTMSKLDFSKGAMTVWDGKLYMAARQIDPCIPIINDLCATLEEDINHTGNDIVLVYDISTDNFSIWSDWYISAWHILEGQLFAQDSRNANVYRVDTQLTDYRRKDISEGTSAPFFWESKYFHYNQPIRGKKEDGVIVLGYMGAGSPLIIKTHLDCQVVLEARINLHDIEDPTNCVSDICNVCPTLDCIDCDGDFNSKFFMVNIGYENDVETFLRQKFSFTRDEGFVEIISIHPRIRQISAGEADALSQCRVNVSEKCFI